MTCALCGEPLGDDVRMLSFTADTYAHPAEVTQ